MCEKTLCNLTYNNKGKTIEKIELMLDSEGDKMVVIRYTDNTWTTITPYIFEGNDYGIETFE